MCCYCNIIVWVENGDEFWWVKNDVGSVLVLMECILYYNMIDFLVFYWVGILGNEVDFLVEEMFYMFIG